MKQQQAIKTEQFLNSFEKREKKICVGTADFY